MGDRTSAAIFGELFEYVSQDPWIPRHEIAEKLWRMAQQYDFSWDQMNCDAHLLKLGLASTASDGGVVYGRVDVEEDEP